MCKMEAHPTEKVYQPCEIKNNNNENFKSNLAQFYMTFITCFFCCTSQMLCTMPTLVLGALHNKEGNSMSLDDDSASWIDSLQHRFFVIGSILLITHPCGALTSGLLSDKLGRKRTLMLLNIPFVISWLLYYYATTVDNLIFATIIMGFAVGLCEAPSASYISESCEPRLRGVSNSAQCAACAMGSMIELYVGAIFDWRTSALLGAGINAVALLLFLTAPESPVWLITKGRTVEAQKALGWFRGFMEPQHVQKEFEDLVSYSEMSAAFSCKNLNGNLEEKAPLDEQEEKHVKEVVSQNWFTKRYKELTNPKMYLPLRLIFIMFFITQTAGLGPMDSYIVEILDRFWFPVDSKWVLVMLSAMSFLGSVAGILLIKLVGKRLLCMVCMVISTISIFGFALYASFLIDTREVVLSGLFIVSLVIFSFAASVGVVNAPWILICEIYPIKGRGMACGISAAVSSLIAFLMTKTYLQTEHIIGLSGMYYLYGAISLAGCIYIFLCMPETEGKTLEQIETYFTPNHDRKEKFRLPSRNSSKA